MGKAEPTIRDLQRVIRDLVSLATIPASWIGREERHVAESAASLILHTLRVDAACVCIASSQHSIKAEKTFAYAGFLAAVNELQAELSQNASPTIETLTRPAWAVPLRVLIQPIGIAGEFGFIAAGCASSGFPSEADSLLLSVTANQLSVAFQTARLLEDKRASEQAARESEERFRAIVDTTPECVKLVARDGALLHINSAGLALVEADDAAAAIGRNVYDLIAPEDRDRFRVFNERVCDGERSSLQFDIIGLKGSRRKMETQAAPLRTASGATVQLAITHDVTERSRAAEARHRLAAIVESSDDAIISKDLRGIVTSWNRGAEAVFGYRPDEMIGQPILRLIPPELHNDESRILQTICRGERIQHFETVRVTKDGRRIDVSLTISPVRDDSGRIVGAAKIARDISQRKDTERALRTTERLASVGRLAATVAHEINNPLEAVTNLVYLARKATLRDDVREFLSNAEEELERVAQITKQTLGFYRETKGIATLQVGSTVESFISVFSRRARNKDATIRTDIHADVAIEAVPGEIRQLIGNLVANSIDAVAPGGRIAVRVAAAQRGGEDGVRLTVADDGHGIPEKVRAHLFQPFFTTKRDVGTGLGLWVGKSIVDKHRGSIRLRTSTRPGRSGTVFSVFLPCHATSVPEDTGATLQQAV
ncbi:MAG TPA: PAS domain S-box protein [Terriglobales bacterium]|nr:PAS domain S-box protein [Terriglobales bacterium]